MLKLYIVLLAIVLATILTGNGIIYCLMLIGQTGYIYPTIGLLGLPTLAMVYIKLVKELTK